MATVSSTVAGSPNVPAFLDLIGISEGTSTSRLTKNDGYDVIVTGVDGPEVFTSYADHPFAGGRAPKIIRTTPMLLSTASGRYQILLRYFEAYKKTLGLRDFSPLSQDRVAIQMLRERKAIDAIVAGDIMSAISAASNIWASFPGNPYGQNPHTMDVLMAHWETVKPQPSSGSAEA